MRSRASGAGVVPSCWLRRSTMRSLCRWRLARRCHVGELAVLEAVVVREDLDIVDIAVSARKGA
eukprot:14171353-Alexandrium_andersonii.AAC.1